MPRKPSKSRFETIDDTPANVPVNFRRPPTLHEQIQQILHSSQIRAEFNAKGIETFEEANDFDIPGEDMSSPYEENFIGQHDKEAALEAAHYETRGTDRVRKTPRRKPASDKKDDAPAKGEPSKASDEK